MSVLIYMKVYFIQLEGEKRGPFSPEELLRQEIHPDTLVWIGDSQTPLPASRVPELQALLSGPHSAQPVRAGQGPSASPRKPPGAGSSFGAFSNPMGIFLVVLAIVLAGAAIYFFGMKGDTGSQTEEISVIHEREVEKAKEELKAEKLAKKQAEERAKQLKLRKSELQSLQAQLRKVTAGRARALSEMDKIRRPRLFRSRAKKEAQLSEQLQLIDRLDAKATSLKTRIARCEVAIDSLSSDGAP